MASAGNIVFRVDSFKPCQRKWDRDLQIYREEDSMANILQYDEARHSLGDYIRDALESSTDVKRVWYNEDREGPMGGVSTQVSGYIELEDGTIAPFAINVYSDHNIERANQHKLDEEERQQELRGRLGIHE